MMDKRKLYKEIESLPPHVLEEVYDYITFLKSRKVQEINKDDITLASEQSLAKDWLLPEEDIAWEGL